MLLQRENNMSPHKICVALMIMLMALSFTVNAEEAKDEETRTPVPADIPHIEIYNTSCLYKLDSRLKNPSVWKESSSLYSS